MDFITLILVLGLITIIVWKNFFSQKIESDSLQKLEDEKQILKEQVTRLTLELEQKSEKIGELSKNIENEKSQKDELSGKNKQLWMQNEKLQSEISVVRDKLTEKDKIISKFEEEKERRTKDSDKRVEDLENSRKALEDERQRIRREDEERIQKEKEDQNRIWADHENKSILKMKDICQKSNLSFTFYENTNLPESFDGKLKPDFLVEFLGQHIIFDAKMNKIDSKNTLQNYLKDQAKSTARKIKESNNADEIYKTVFFVVPYVKDLKETTFFEEGIEFHTISLEGFEPIISTLKKVTYYENIEKIDPKERENIVSLIAAYDQHISHQNAVNILSSMMGIQVAQKKGDLDPEMQKEIEIEKKKMRVENFKPTDLKRLIQNPEEQINEMKNLISSQKPKIGKEDIDDAKQSLF